MLAPQQAATHADDDQAAADASYYRAVLHEFIDIGLDLARTLRPTAEPAPEPASKPAEPPASPTTASAAPSAAPSCSPSKSPKPGRGQPLPSAAPPPAAKSSAASASAIEEKRLKPEQAETLHAELHERLDRPELDEDIRHRPIGELIAEIRRDLGLDNVPGVRAFKRRTPADLAALHTRAAQPPAPEKPSPAGGLGAQGAPRLAEGGSRSRHDGVCSTTEAATSPEPEPSRPAIPPDIIRPPNVERQDVNRLIRRLAPNSS